VTAQKPLTPRLATGIFLPDARRATDASDTWTDDEREALMIRVAVLDDYQMVAESFADWTVLC
jgi:hypothetical protein